MPVDEQGRPNLNDWFLSMSDIKKHLLDPAVAARRVLDIFKTKDANETNHMEAKLNE